MTANAIREPGNEGGWRVIDAAVAMARRRLGAELVSAYAIGSLAHGGFSAAVSDVDLALLTAGEDDLTRVVEAIRAEVRAGVGGGLAERLSIFHVSWARFAAPPPDARFPAIARQDLVRCGVLVAGEDRRAEWAAAPAGREVVEEAIAFALQRLTPEHVAASLSELTGGAIEVRGTSKLVLSPLRLLHVAQTAMATGNRAAVAHYADTATARHATLARLALRWREAGRVAEPDAARARLEAELLPLHEEVFERLSLTPGMPHRDVLGASASRFRA